MDPQSLFRAWVPGGMGGSMSGASGGSDAWDQFQKAFWAAMPDADKKSGK